MGVVAGSTVPDRRRERQLEARIEKKLDRKLNRILGQAKLVRRPWELVRLDGRLLIEVPVSWQGFVGSRNMEVIAVTRAGQHYIVAAYARSLRGPRVRFYWCATFPWDRLGEVEAAYLQVYKRAEASQSNAGQAFQDKLAAIWEGQRFSSREEYNALQTSIH